MDDFSERWTAWASQPTLATPTIPQAKMSTTAIHVFIAAAADENYVNLAPKSGEPNLVRGILNELQRTNKVHVT